MGKLKNKRAADVLLETLGNDQDGWVRAGIAIGIGEMPYDQRHADALFKASMNDPDWRVRGEASDALGKICEK